MEEEALWLVSPATKAEWVRVGGVSRELLGVDTKGLWETREQFAGLQEVGELLVSTGAERLLGDEVEDVCSR